jgi:hypothetical protein
LVDGRDLRHTPLQSPTERAGLMPADVFTGSTVPRHQLKEIHVWGCPVYVLDPHLQAGQNFLVGIGVSSWDLEISTK